MKKVFFVVALVVVFNSVLFCGVNLNKILFKNANIFWQQKNFRMAEKLYENCLSIDSKNEKFLYRYLLSKVNLKKYAEVTSYFDQMKDQKFSAKMSLLRRNAKSQLFIQNRTIENMIKKKKIKEMSSNALDFKVVPAKIKGESGEKVKIVLSFSPFFKSAKDVFIHLGEAGYPYYCNFLSSERKKNEWEISFIIKKKISSPKVKFPVYYMMPNKKMYFVNISIIFNKEEYVKHDYTCELEYLDDQSITLAKGKATIRKKVWVVSGQTLNYQSLDKGKVFEVGTDYFIWLILSKDGPEGIISKKKKLKGGKLIGYFHYGPSKKILKFSITTNDNLDSKTLRPGIPLPGMVKVGSFAIDIYENSIVNGKAVSKYKKTPKAYLDQGQCRLLAMDIWKRLPTSSEWFLAAQGCNDPDMLYNGTGEEFGNIWSMNIPVNSIDCNGLKNYPNGKNGVNMTNYTKTGTCLKDVSGYDCYDMIGNMREWTDDVTTGKELDHDGYITKIDGNGNVLEVGDVPDKRFNGDYYLSPKGKKWNGFLRGGCWYYGEKGGIYSLNLFCPETYFSYSTGFRCAR